MAMSLKYSGCELHNIVLIRMRGDLRMLHTASRCARVIGSSWYSDSGYCCQPHHAGAHSLGCECCELELRDMPIQTIHTV